MEKLADLVADIIKIQSRILAAALPAIGEAATNQLLQQFAGTTDLIIVTVAEGMAVAEKAPDKFEAMGGEKKLVSVLEEAVSEFSQMELELTPLYAKCVRLGKVADELVARTQPHARA